MNLRRQGFNIGMVSFDRWQSFDIQNELQAVGIRTETVSVAKKHYEDLAMMIYEERVAIPMIPILLEEMSELKIRNMYTVQKEKSVVIVLFFYSDIFCVISDFLYFLTLITCILHCTMYSI